jgi:hypothetical protein
MHGVGMKYFCTSVYSICVLTVLSLDHRSCLCNVFSSTPFFRARERGNEDFNHQEVVTGIFSQSTYFIPSIHKDG